MRYCLDLPNGAAIAGQWLYDWQTLLSGMLALGAAFLAASQIRKQIVQVEKHETERRTRKFNAVRATLPLALSGICSFSKNMLTELSQVRSAISHLGSVPVPKSFNPPSPPSELVSALQDMVEATAQTNVIAAISEIISEIQTLSSRVDGLSDNAQIRQAIGMDRNIDEYIIQTARMYALAEALFDFARRKDEFGPKELPWDRVYSALHFTNIEDHQFPDLYADLQRRSQRVAFAWHSDLS